MNYITNNLLKIMEKKFDFDDIFIIPEINTDINSRYKDITLPDNLPLFTAPMDTVVDLTNIDEFIEAGINVVLPRTVSYDDFWVLYNRNPKKYEDVFISFGLDNVNELLVNNDYARVPKLHLNANILIDVANGHMKSIVEVCRNVKKIRPDIKIMVGNIANPETYAWYASENCVDYIRIFIGSGGGCLTTKNSGIGNGTASLIKEINEIREFLYHEGYNNLPKIIADGGIKDYADVIKALNLGADYVMLGSVFNKSLESAGLNYIYGIKINKKIAKFLYAKGFPVKKYFRGMSTKAAQKAMGKKNIKTSEGVVRYRRIEYRLKGWIENFTHYLRSSMSYSDCKTLDEFVGKSNYITITQNVYKRINK